MIADTSFIIDLIQGDEKAIEEAKRLEKDGEPLKLSAATVFELYTGVARSDKPSEEKKRVLEVIGSKQVLDTDEKVMKKAGMIHGNLINEGKRIGTFDCIIAASARVREEELITGNEKDFEKIPELRIKSY